MQNVSTALLLWKLVYKANMAYYDFSFIANLKQNERPAVTLQTIATDNVTNSPQSCVLSLLPIYIDTTQNLLKIQRLLWPDDIHYLYFTTAQHSFQFNISYEK